VEYDLEKQVAQLLAKIVKVVSLDCIGDLIGLLKRVGRYAGEVLLQIPWATGDRGAQRRHNLKEP
jgi:hypothetical protein